MPIGVVNGVGRGMGVLDEVVIVEGEGAVSGVNLGRPIVINGAFATRLFSNYFADLLLKEVKDKAPSTRVSNRRTPAVGNPGVVYSAFTLATCTATSLHAPAASSIFRRHEGGSLCCGIPRLQPTNQKMEFLMTSLFCSLPLRGLWAQPTARGLATAHVAAANRI